MIRSNNIADIQECFVQLFDALTSPWSTWDIINGWPDTEILEAASKAFVYVLNPQKSGSLFSQGGTARNYWNIITGFWVTRDKGGLNEVAAWQAAIINLIQNPQTVHSTVFTVEIGGTTFADTTLKAQKISVIDITGQRPIDTGDIQEFRAEATINIIA